MTSDNVTFLERCERNPSEWLKIPAGAPREAAELVPISLRGQQLCWQQGEERLCVPLSLANALTYLGFQKDAEKVVQFAEYTDWASLQDPLKELWLFVQRHLKLWTPRTHGFGETRSWIYEDLAKMNYVCVLQLLDSIGNAEHCVTCADGWLFDSTELHAIRLCPSGLDRCCTPNSFRSIFKALYLEPSCGKEKVVEKVMLRSAGGRFEKHY